MIGQMGWHNDLHESGYWRFCRACRAKGASRPTTGDEVAAATAINEAAKTAGEMRTIMMKLDIEKLKFVGALYTSPYCQSQGLSKANTHRKKNSTTA
jgi:hypothetical protein